MTQIIVIPEKQDVANHFIELLIHYGFIFEKEDLKLSNTFNDLGLEDFDEAELIMAIEDEFDIEIYDDEEESIKNFTIEEIIDFIFNKLFCF